MALAFKSMFLIHGKFCWFGENDATFFTDFLTVLKRPESSYISVSNSIFKII